MNLTLIACVSTQQEVETHTRFAESTGIKRMLFAWCGSPSECPSSSFPSQNSRDSSASCCWTFFEFFREELLSNHEKLLFLLQKAETEQVFFIEDGIHAQIVNKPSALDRGGKITEHVVAQVITSQPPQTQQTQLSCFVSIYNADNYMINLLNEMKKQKEQWSRIEWMIGLFPHTNQRRTNDSIFQLAKNLPNIRLYVFADCHLSLYELWNFFIPRTSAPFLSSFHPDDVRPTTWVQQCLSVLTENPNLGLVTPMYSPFSSKGCRTNNNTWFTKRYRRDGMQQHINGSNYFSCRDLFSVEHRRLVAYDIPNCSPVWRRSVHFLSPISMQTQLPASTPLPASTSASTFISTYPSTPIPALSYKDRITNHSREEFVLKFDETRDVAADFLLWLKLGEKYDMFQLTSCVVYFRISADQLHRKNLISKKTLRYLATIYAPELLLLCDDAAADDDD